MATVSERARELRARTWTKIGFDTNEPDFTQRYDKLIEQALLAERRLAKLEDAEIAESLYDKTYWDDPSAGIAASLRAAAEKEV